MVNIIKTNDGLSFTVKIVPNSSKNSIETVLDGMLKIKIAAVPEKGKANKMLKQFLAKRLGIKPKDIEILAGITSPVKKIEIKNIEMNTLIEGIS